MSRLLLVRHGQTRGFLTGDYVDLTDLGVAQARALGRWWRERGPSPDAVVVGPAPRHRQTFDHAAVPGWPEPVELAALDEHAGMAVVLHALQGGAVSDEVAAAFRVDGREARLRAFQVLMAAWIEGRIAPEGVEPWSAFRARVAGALDTLCEGGGRTVVAFTSGGVVGTAVASVLGVPTDRTALDLAFAVVNASVTELRWSGPRRGLFRFNAVDHLDDALASAV